VGSSDDSVGVDERSTTEVGSTALKRDDEGELGRSSGSSTNNVLIRSILREGVVGVLGRGRRKSQRGKRNSDEGCETHGEGFEVRVTGGKTGRGLEVKRQATDWMLADDSIQRDMPPYLYTSEPLLSV
jgi:hypothetical protein